MPPASPDLLPGVRVVLPDGREGREVVLLERQDSFRTGPGWRAAATDGSAEVFVFPLSALGVSDAEEASETRHANAPQRDDVSYNGIAESEGPGDNLGEPEAPGGDLGEPEAPDYSQFGRSEAASPCCDSGDNLRPETPLGNEVRHIVTEGSRRRRASIKVSSYITSEEDNKPLDDKTVKSRLRSVLASPQCETGIAVIILINFVLTYMEADAEAAGEEPATWRSIGSLACYLSVVVEFAARTFVEGRQAFSSKWHRFDLFIVISGIVEQVIQRVKSDIRGVGVISILRCSRLVGVARITRSLQHMEELTRLLEMTGSCARTLLWAFLLMGFVMTFWAILAVEVVRPCVVELAQSHGLWADCERCRRSFDSVFEANLTLFQSIVAGDSWGMVAVPVIEFQPWTGIIFLGSLLTLVFGVLNLTTAVVVDTFAEARAKDILRRGDEMESEERREKEMWSQMFQKIDNDASGGVSYDELKEGARRIVEFRHWLRVLDIDAADLRMLFEMCDQDGSGEIDMEEFTEAMFRMKNAESKTATRFVKHMITDLQKRQVDFEQKVTTEMGDVKTQVQTCEKTLTSGALSEVLTQAGGDQTVDGEALLDDVIEQLQNMEENIQKATRDAMEVSLRAAVDAMQGELQKVTGEAMKFTVHARRRLSLGGEPPAWPPADGRRRRSTLRDASPKFASAVLSEGLHMDGPPPATRRRWSWQSLSEEDGGDDGSLGAGGRPQGELRGPRGPSPGPPPPFPSGFEFENVGAQDVEAPLPPQAMPSQGSARGRAGSKSPRRDAPRGLHAKGGDECS